MQLPRHDDLVTFGSIVSLAFNESVFKDILVLPLEFATVPASQSNIGERHIAWKMCNVVGSVDDICQGVNITPQYFAFQKGAVSSVTLSIVELSECRWMLCNALVESGPNNLVDILVRRMDGRKACLMLCNWFATDNSTSRVLTN